MGPGMLQKLIRGSFFSFAAKPEMPTQLLGFSQWIQRRAWAADWEAVERPPLGWGSQFPRVVSVHPAC